VQQAWQATVEGVDLAEYAREHIELDQSLKKFGANPNAA
jgi:ribulose 1,5-bisphosphate carboxylase large subunit-like protein